MFSEHETGKKRKLDAVGSHAVAETDEQLARRLHEELNALTRHSRRGTNALAPITGSTQRNGVKPAKASAAESKAAGKSRQQATHADLKQEAAHADVNQEAAAAEAGADETALAKADKPRKRSMLNRELAMLVTDMVETHVKPVTGPRLKGKDEQDQQDQRQQQEDNHSAALKHESSSSLSEQERLATEHLHAAGTVTKPVNKLLEAPHLAARTSDSGGAGGDSCTTGATSSGKACSSGPEHEQQQTSGQQRSLQQPSGKHVQRSGIATSTDASAQGRSMPANSTADCAGNSSKPIKIPKLPMVQYGKKWYRAKVLKDAGSKVMLEYQGFSHEGGPFWLSKDHQRIWRGSYKGRDWRYLGDGAWEPKVTDKSDARARPHRRAQHHHQRSSAEAAAAGAASDGAGVDSDAEQVHLHIKRKSAAVSARRFVDAAGAGAASDAAASERDTESTDQEDADEEAAALAEPLTVDSPAMPEHKAEPEQQPLQQQDPPKQDARAKGQPQEQETQQPQQQRRFKDNELQATAQQQEQQPAESASAGQQQVQLQKQQTIEVDSPPEQDVKVEQQQKTAATVLNPETAQQVQQQLPRVQDKQPKASEKQQVKLLEKQHKTADKLQKAADKLQKTTDKQDKPADTQQKICEKPLHRRRRRSEADSSVTANKAAMQDSPAAKTARKTACKATVQQAAPAAAPAIEAAPAAAAAEAVGQPSPTVEAAAAPGDSSTEHQTGGAAVPAALAQLKVASEPVEDTVSAPARSASTVRGRYSRKNKAAAAAALTAAAGSDNADTAHTAATPAVKTKRGGRGARSRSAAAAQSQDSASREREQQQPQGSDSKGPSLEIDASKAMKHSSSSEGLPTSPTSPVAGSGGSPRAHRRKGKPQRARLDSDDLQRPAKKIKAVHSYASGIDAFDHPMLHELPELQAVQQPQPQPQQQEGPQVQAPASLGWKGGWKGAYKKGIWQHQSQQQEQEQPSGGKSGVLDHTQKQQHQDSWSEQQQQQTTVSTSVAAGEGHMHSEQPHLLGGSDPEDLEAACVLVGASMGRAHSGEVFGAYDPLQQQQHIRAGEVGLGSHPHRSFSAGFDDAISPRGYASMHGRQNGRRRGHNWSKPLNNRPPRPPPQQGLQHANMLARRHSLNGSSSQQQAMFSAAELQHAHGGSQEMPAAVLPKGFSRQTSLPDPAVCSQQQPPRRRNGSCLLFGNDSNSKAATLRVLLDAVGEVQATSGRPDLMYPLQYGGLPIGTSEPARSCTASLQHVHMSAAATALLAAVPTLEALHQMAVQGQAGLAACLSGCAPSLFQ